MSEKIVKQAADDGIDRRGFLQCMAWVGTAVIWSLGPGGILTSRALGADAPESAGDFTFAQISDSHIGFSKEPNRDVTGTLQLAIDRLNRLNSPPELLLHTGDLTHLSKPSEFDTVEQILRGAKVGKSFYVPGEHDVFTDDGQAYRDRFG